ncbi:CRISPR-associated ring nuclease Csm6 [Psychrobacter pocilloporae]|uniref:TIGR02584 family CRISPR-associated protein n=1 Tax=Psychrobacter pocilloporae TaxID=1775882 RepID=A0ABT6ITE2_9GAMM|nr:CRISPR-associated ring nuclease Csm6 [Psychrobacter pocilloporae]MDH4905101.1 TIGR02584 family CRISPR-associated protein [Psychrobacter pocilloporae]
MSRNILFLVTGMTPQIVTETIWALACDDNADTQWVPDEVHVLSTQDGLNQIRKRLFEQKVFEQFKHDYPIIKDVQFNPTDSLHVITDTDGKALSDLKTPEDNERSADIICKTIKAFTSMPDTSVHVSIAGGRKTMGFYAGYALSLYGRAQDAMSHVLVEEKFEKAVNFFYPTPTEHLVSDRDEKVVGNAQEAQVWLANIPFVRMRTAILPKHQLNQDDSFSEVVQKINASYEDTTLTLNVFNRKVIINDQFEIDNLPLREWAFLMWFAQRRQQGLNGVVCPTKNINERNINPEQIAYINQLTQEYCEHYEEHKYNDDLEISVDKKFFQGAKSRLQTALKDALGIELAAKLDITNESGKGSPFQLRLAPEAITINHVPELT